MKLIILIGPPAVGKMTVGQALEGRSGLKLFHNHMTIELVAPFFSYGTPEGRALVRDLREVCLQAFAQSDADGYIFTYVWAFEEAGERAYIEGVASTFESKGCEIFWIELTADQTVRLDRNRTENRLHHKPTKRDVEWSDTHLIESEQKYRFTSNEGEIAAANYLRIDNTDLPAEDVAKQIWDYVTAQSLTSG